MSSSADPKPLPDLEVYDSMVGSAVSELDWRTVTDRYPIGSAVAGLVVARLPFGAFLTSMVWPWAC
jgi:hypothetical protein